MPSFNQDIVLTARKKLPSSVRGSHRSHSQVVPYIPGVGEGDPPGR